MRRDDVIACVTLKLLNLDLLLRMKTEKSLPSLWQMIHVPASALPVRDVISAPTYSEKMQNTLIFQGLAFLQIIQKGLDYLT